MESPQKGQQYLMLYDDSDLPLGQITQRGHLHLFDETDFQQEKIENIIKHTQMFYEKPITHLGLSEVAEYNDYYLGAELDTNNAETLYFTYSVECDRSDLDNQVPMTDLDTAKQIFAQESGLIDYIPHEGFDYRNGLMRKFEDLLEANGYEIQFGGVPNGIATITLDDQMVATLDNNLSLVTTGNKKISENLNSIMEQAKYQQESEDAIYPLLIKKLTDFCINLGYSVRHKIQDFAILFQINFQGKEIATVTPDNKLRFSENANSNDISKIETFYKTQLAEITKTVQSLKNEVDSLKQKKQEEKMPDESPFPEPPPYHGEKYQPYDEIDTGETSSQLSRVEAALVLALLDTPAGKNLTQKMDCSKISLQLQEKIADEYPDLPRIDKANQVSDDLEFDRDM